MELIKIRWFPFVFIGIAAISAYLFSIAEKDAFQKYAACGFGISLGSALLLWGLQELIDGKIRGARVYVHRKENPLIFFLLLIGKRFCPGFIMLCAAFWFVFLR